MIHKDGKNSRPYVFTIHSQHLSSHPVQTLDVAADSLEDLTSWVGRIREAAQNADARVRVHNTTHEAQTPSDCNCDACLSLWQQMQEEKQMERRKKIAVELSELVVYCRPVPFNEDSKEHVDFLYLIVFLFRYFTSLTCRFQRSGRSGHVIGTCRLSQRRRRRSLPLAAEENASCSTTGVSFPEFIPEDRDWTRPTTTLCPCGSAAPSWSHSTFRLQVGKLINMCAHVAKTI